MTVTQLRPTYFQQYTQFASACEIPEGHINHPANQAAIALGERLVIEEWENETKPALQLYKTNPTLENLAEVADGIADTIYVLCQLARALDVPLDRVWTAVHSANMRKITIGPDGKIARREDGKILKPKDWKAPDIFGMLLDYSNQRAAEDGACGAENWDEFKKNVKALKNSEDSAPQSRSTPDVRR